MTPSLKKSKIVYNTYMTILVSKKKAQEHLQEIRHPHKNGIRFRKRKQEEKEAEKYAKEDLQRMKEEKHAPTGEVY